MQSASLRQSLSYLCGLILCLVLVGCSDSEKKEKVDLNAQVSGLAGDTEAKVNALAEIAKLGPGGKSALDKIIPLLKHEDSTVRRTAAYALGAIGPDAKAAIPELKALLNTQDRDQMTAAANAIQNIDPKVAPGGRIDNVSN